MTFSLELRAVDCFSSEIKIIDLSENVVRLVALNVTNKL